MNNQIVLIGFVVRLGPKRATEAVKVNNNNSEISHNVFGQEEDEAQKKKRDAKLKLFIIIKTLCTH
jgi:hypothetical protein